MPLMRRDGSCFGTLCTLDPLPSNVDERDLDVFRMLASLIAFELEADEQQRRREAEMRALEDFIAIAAHDLRQPLTAMSVQAQMLARHLRRDTPLPSLIERTEALQAQIRRAVLLSDTLLDMARLQTSGLTLDVADFDLVTLLRRSIEDVQVVVPRHSFELEAPQELLVDGDEQRIGQVLRNLLDNAAKYAPAERGPTKITVCPDHAVEGHIIVSVRDQGAGVTDAELPHLFERRYRAASAVADHTSGSGLGLYIAQQIVNAHHGHIWAENAPSGGLVVNVRLPLRHKPA